MKLYSIEGESEKFSSEYECLLACKNISAGYTLVCESGYNIPHVDAVAEITEYLDFEELFFIKELPEHLKGKLKEAVTKVLVEEGEGVVETFRAESITTAKITLQQLHSYGLFLDVSPFDLSKINEHDVITRGGIVVQEIEEDVGRLLCVCGVVNGRVTWWNKEGRTLHSGRHRSEYVFMRKRLT